MRLVKVSNSSFHNIIVASKQISMFCLSRPWPISRNLPNDTYSNSNRLSKDFEKHLFFFCEFIRKASHPLINSIKSFFLRSFPSELIIPDPANFQSCYQLRVFRNKNESWRQRAASLSIGVILCCSANLLGVKGGKNSWKTRRKKGLFNKTQWK